MKMSLDLPIPIVSHQPRYLTEQVRELCQLLERAKYQKGLIHLLELQENIKVAIKHYWSKRHLVHKSLVQDLVQCLENKDICSRIHESLLALIAELILRSEKSRFAERGIYLLADLLFNDSRLSEESHQRYFYSNKRELIRNELIPLFLEYLFSSDKNSAMRRWVGLLCFRLIQEYIKYHDNTDMSSDKYRNQLDQAVIKSHDILLETICGQFSKNQSNMRPQIERQCSKNNKTLIRKSLRDELSEKNQLSDYPDGSSNYLNECQKQSKIFIVDSMATSPSHQLDHNYQKIYMTLEKDLLIILALLTTGGFDQIVEVPFQSIAMLRFNFYPSKDEVGLSVIDIQFKQDLENSILFNGKEVKLSYCSLRLSPPESKSFQNYLTEFPIGLNIEWDTVSTRTNDPQDVVDSRITPHCSVSEIEVRGFPKASNASLPENIVCKTIYDQRSSAYAALSIDSNDQSVKITEKIHDTQWLDDKLPERKRFQRQFPIVRQKLTSKHNTIKPRAKQPLIASRRSTNHCRGQNFGSTLSVVKQPSKIPEKDDPKKDVSKYILKNSNMITTKITPSTDSHPWQSRPENKCTSNRYGNENKNIMAMTKIIEKRTENTNGKKPLFAKRNTGTRASARIIRKNEKQKSVANHFTINSPEIKEQDIRLITKKNEILLVKDLNNIIKELSRSPPIFKAETVQNHLKSKSSLNKFPESESKAISSKIVDFVPVSPIIRGAFDQDSRLPALASEKTKRKLDFPKYYNASPRISHRSLENIQEKLMPPICKILTPNPKEISCRYPEYNMMLAEGLSSMMHEMNNDHLTQTREEEGKISARNAIEKVGVFKTVNRDINQSKNTGSTVEQVLDENGSNKISLSCESPQADIMIYSVQRTSVAKNGLQTAGRSEISSKKDKILEPNSKEAQSPPNNMIFNLYSIPQDFISPEADDDALRTSKSEDVVFDSVKKRRTDESNSTRPERKRRNMNQHSLNFTEDFFKPNKDYSHSRDEKVINQHEIHKNKRPNSIEIIVPSLWQQQEPKYQQEKCPCNVEEKNISALQEKISCKNHELSKVSVVQNSLIVGIGSIDEGKQNKICTPEALGKSPKIDEMLLLCNNVDEKVAKEQREKTIPALDANNLLLKTSLNDSFKVKKPLKGSGIYSTSPFSSKQDYASRDLIVESSLVVSGVPAIVAKESAVSSSRVNSSPNKNQLGTTSRFFEKSASLTSSQRLSFQGPTVTAGGSPIGKNTCDNDYIQEWAPGLNEKSLLNQKHFMIVDQSSKSGPSPLAQKGMESGPSSPLEDKTGLVLHETIDGVHYRDMNSHEVISQKAIQDPFYIQDFQLPRQIPLLGLSGARSKKSLEDKGGQLSSSKNFQLFPQSEKSPAGKLNEENLPGDPPSNIQKDKKHWNTTIRGRYDGVHDTIHRIADDLIIRLAEEEDRMKLIVNQYVENGAKLVEDLSKCHEEKNRLVLKFLEAKKIELLDVENKAQASISEIFQKLNINKIGDTMKKWEGLQDKIRVAIDEGRRESTWRS